MQNIKSDPIFFDMKKGIIKEEDVKLWKDLNIFSSFSALYFMFYCMFSQDIIDFINNVTPRGTSYLVLIPLGMTLTLTYWLYIVSGVFSFLITSVYIIKFRTVLPLAFITVVFLLIGIWVSK